MAQIKLTKRGQALVAKEKLERRKRERRIAVSRKNEFKVYTLKNTGKRVLVNESKIFPAKPEYMMRAA